MDQKQKAEVTMMQETYCTKSKLNAFKNSWNGPSYYGLKYAHILGE